MQITLLAITAVFFGTVGPIIAYSLFFTSMKGYAGGAHAKRHWSCIGGYSLMAQASCLLCRLIGEPYDAYLAVLASTAALLLVVWKAPVPHPNNPKPKRKLVLFRKIAIRIALLQLAITLSALALGANNMKLFLAGALGGLTASLSLLMPMPKGDGG